MYSIKVWADFRLLIYSMTDLDISVIKVQGLNKQLLNSGFSLDSDSV